VRRHKTDVVSLVAGLLFLVVAVVHISARATDTDLNLRWLAPATLVLLGVLGLLGALRSPRGAADAAVEAPEPVTAPVTDEPGAASTEE
jgi:heme A synthase